jgi:hypothetical protein
MTHLTAEQKVRQALTGHPHTDPTFQHEGPTVIRWITGGTAPSIYTNFHQEGDQTASYCPQCGEKFGQFDTEYKNSTYREIAKIREVGYKHRQQHENTES